MSYGTLEIEIMNTLWDLQDRNEDANISVNDVVDALNPGEYFYKGPEIKGQIVYKSLGDEFDPDNIPKI